MSVAVTHYNHDEMGRSTTEHESDSWNIDENGHLTIADSVGNPEASYHNNNWLSVVKVNDDEDED